jgi:hypothetical protein
MRRTLVALLLIAAPASLGAQYVCEPRAAARDTVALDPTMRATVLAGNWELTVWVNGRGVPDTIIKGRLSLFPRLVDSTFRSLAGATPLIGDSDIDLEYLPGMPTFRTPAASVSRITPGVELRVDNDGMRLVFGNPTVIAPTAIVSLDAGQSATFHIFYATHAEFRGQWSLARGGDDRPWGGYCATRLRL